MQFFRKQQPKRIYADAAAATPLAPEVKEVMLSMFDIYGNPGALHKEGSVAKEALEAARREAAGAIGAHHDEVVFASSGTEANNLALFGVLAAQESEARHVITSSIEHPSVLEPLKRQEKHGVRVSYLDVTEDGLLDLKRIHDAITDETILITLALINSEIGTVQDIRGIAKMVRKIRKERTLRLAQGKKVLPLLIHVDASQAPLWMTLRVEQLGIDLMTLDGQKILGPKGVGALYVRRGTPIFAQTLGGDQERGLRAGTENVPLVSGFARALSLAQKACEKNAVHVSSLRDELLRDIRLLVPEVVVNGSMSDRVANNLNISIPGLVGELAVIALSAKGIAASTRSACSTSDDDASHVLVGIGRDQKTAREALRLSFLPSLTLYDIAAIYKALREVCERYRGTHFD